MDIQKLVETYIKLRDRRKTRKAAYEMDDQKDKGYQEQIEQKLMAFFNETGGESFRTDAGTAYKTTRTSATVQDWPATLDFIKSHEAWDMLEQRVSKSFVETYIEENQEAPPGVGISRVTVVNVRRGA